MLNIIMLSFIIRRWCPNHLKYYFPSLGRDYSTFTYDSLQWSVATPTMSGKTPPERMFWGYRILDGFVTSRVKDNQFISSFITLYGAIPGHRVKLLDSSLYSFTRPHIEFGEMSTNMEVFLAVQMCCNGDIWMRRKFLYLLRFFLWINYYVENSA